MSDATPTIHIVLTIGRDLMVSKPIALFRPDLEYYIHCVLPMECSAETSEDMPIIRKLKFRYMGRTTIVDNQECLLYEFDSRCLC